MLLHGVVQQVIPYYGYYTVIPFGGGPAIPCRLARDTSAFIFSGKALGGPQPTDVVWFTVSRLSSYGVILAVDPGFIGARDPYLHDYMTQAAPTAPAADKLLLSHLTASNKLADYSNGGILDATGLERGFVFPTGPGVMVDPWMAMLRADENCGVWAFFFDQLLRLHGHNLQLRSSTYEAEYLDDGGELLGVEGYSPYAWEALGSFQRGTPVGKFHTTEETQLSTPYVGGGEPVDDYQIPYRRLTTFRGYLGQGYRSILTIPPESGSQMTIGGKSVIPGVYQESLSLAGDYAAASARSLMFYHVPKFAVPVPDLRPEDPTGNEGNQSQNDQITAGVGGTRPTGGAAGQAMLDDLAFSMNWRSQHPFDYRSKDWYTPPNSKLPAANLSNVSTATDSKVDHRHSAPYQPTIGAFGFQEDGSFLISDGGGAEILLSQGKIYLRGLSIQLESGEDIVSLAGRDQVIRAYRSAELVGATEDVRIKADQRLEMLGGSSGIGGVILESKSVSSKYDFGKVGTDAVFGGIIIKSTGNIVNIGSQMYLRTTSGALTLDAAAGKADITTNSSSFNRYMLSGATDQFNGKISNRFNGTSTLISGDVRVEGNITGTGSVTVRNSLTISEGHVATSLSKQYDGKIVQLSNNGLVSARSVVENVEIEAKTANTTATSQKESLNAYYQDSQAGNSLVIENMGFSFRTTTQCEASEFKLYESRWAMQRRILGMSVSTWSEPPVRRAGQDTYPFPGETVWMGDEAFVQQDPTLFDVSDGRAESPGDVYKNSEFAEPTKLAPQDNYPRL